MYWCTNNREFGAPAFRPEQREPDLPQLKKAAEHCSTLVRANVDPSSAWPVAMFGTLQDLDESPLTGLELRRAVDVVEWMHALLWAFSPDDEIAELRK